MATILIPSPLRKFTNNLAKVPTRMRSISELIVELTTAFPQLKRHLLDNEGNLTSFINIFVDNDDIRNLDLVQTKIDEGAVVSIVPAIAGGIRFPLK